MERRNRLRPRGRQAGIGACSAAMRRVLSHAMEILDTLRAALGPAHVLTGKDTEKWARDWTGKYSWTPRAVVRPANTEEVSAVAHACYAAGAPTRPSLGRPRHQPGGAHHGRGRGHDPR